MYNTTEYDINDIKRKLDSKQTKLDRLTAMQDNDTTALGMMSCAFGNGRLKEEVEALTEQLAAAEKSLIDQQ